MLQQKQARKIALSHGVVCSGQLGQFNYNEKAIGYAWHR